MFEKSNYTDVARFCCVGIESFRRWRFVPFFMAVLAVAALTGCSTYYGYDDVKYESRVPMPDGAPRDIRHYAVVTTENGEASLKCFKLFDLPKNTMSTFSIVGREEKYRDYDAWYYFENSPYNAGWNKDAWLFSQCSFFWSKAIEERAFPVDRNCEYWPWTSLFPPFIIGNLSLGMLLSVLDAPVFLTASLVDSCLFIGRCCWTGVSIPCAWFCGRTFGWMGDWHLTEHQPGPLRKLSYMPFINLFIFQTPPYMTDGPNRYETVRYDESDRTVLKRTHIVTLTPEYRAHALCKVDARVLCNGQLCGSREFRTDDNGGVLLTEFLRECVAAAPLTARDFSLELKLSDNDGNMLLTRKVEFKAEQVMSTAAARDLAAYRRSDTDCLNKLLLSRRSHREWRQELFADDLAIPMPGGKQK